MPKKITNRSIPAKQYYKNVSFETLVASWFTNDGWEVFLPMIDHDMKTDLLVFNDDKFLRIQVKTVDTNNENFCVENKWGDIDIDYVVYFSRSGDWGYITKPFKQKHKRLNSSDHVRFHQHPKPFIKAFVEI